MCSSLLHAVLKKFPVTMLSNEDEVYSVKKMVVCSAASLPDEPGTLLGCLLPCPVSHQYCRMMFFVVVGLFILLFFFQGIFLSEKYLQVERSGPIISSY